MKAKHLFVISSFFLLTNANIFAQVGVTSYPLSTFGLNTSKEKRFSGELKMLLNKNYEDISFEVASIYNFKARKYHRFSVGIGMDFSPFTGKEPIVEWWNALTFPVQLEIFPIQNFRQLSCVTEIAPGYTSDSNFVVRYFWGIRYTFKL